MLPDLWPGAPPIWPWSVTFWYFEVPISLQTRCFNCSGPGGLESGLQGQVIGTGLPDCRDYTLLESWHTDWPCIKGVDGKGGGKGGATAAEGVGDQGGRCQALRHT
jgi:hypothetical protein